jgi:uncharacterized protein YegJ (DUF2314 family)
MRHLALVLLLATSASAAVEFSVSAYLPTTGVDGDRILKQLTGSRFADWASVTSSVLPASERPVPDGKLLELMSRELPAWSRKALQAAGRVQVLGFSMRAPDLPRLKRSCELVAAFALVTGAVLRDDSSGKFYDAAGWKRTHVDSWKGSVPEVEHLIVVHAVTADDGSLSLDTMGMQRFGLPDLVIPKLPRGADYQGGMLLNAVAQHMIENPGSEARARVDLPASDGTVPVHLRAARAGEYEHDSPALIVSCATPPGDELAALHTVMQRMFAQPGGIVGAQAGDPEMDAARARAQKRLGELAEVYRRGAPDGASLAVKASFATAAGGVEWMWVSVRRWENGVLEGILMNHPADVPGLGVGSRVTAKQAELFDFVYREPGKPEEGGETNQILIRRSAGADR